VAIRLSRSLDNGFSKVIVSILGTPDGTDITGINNITRFRFIIYLWLICGGGFVVDLLIS
jgi:hypothetical protein